MPTRLCGIAAFAALAISSATAAFAAPAPPPPIEAYGKLPDIDHVAISPSGKRFAFMGSTPQGRVLFVNEIDKPLMREQIDDSAPGGAKKDAKITNIKFADEDHVIVELDKTELVDIGNPEKHDFHGVGILNLPRHNLTWVFKNDDNIVHNVLGVFGYTRKDGHIYGYFAGQMISAGRVTEEINLFRVDLDSGQLVHVGTGKTANTDYDWLVGPDGTVLAHMEYDRRSQEWRVFGEAHNEVLAKGKDRYNDTAFEGLGRTPDSIVYLARDPDGVSHYYETALTAGGQQTPLFDDAATYGLMHDPVTRLLDGVGIDADYPDIRFTDQTRETRWQAIKEAFPKGYNIGLAASDDTFDHLIIYTEAQGDAGTYWYIDLKAMNVVKFGQAYPGVPAATVGPRKVVDYKAADGLELHGILTLPAGREPKGLPVVVLPHGGPQARDYLGFDWWAYALASRGYAVFQPNFRGSSGYSQAFVKAGDGEWGRKMQTDISDGLKYLAEQGVVDPKRACIVGGSYGGYAALAGVTVQHGLYRCAVAVAGVSDLRGMLAEAASRADTTYGDPGLRRWKDRMGAKGLNDSSLREISPANLADKADAPILLIHGKDDTIVPIEQSRIMERALKAAGKLVEFVVLDGEDHHMSREPTRIAMLEAMVAFVEKHNPPN
jgi:dipeptidyl aminopeptidase/acylaminoacyl peptidase